MIKKSLDFNNFSLPKFVIHVPTAKEEFRSLLHVLEELPFFIREGYNVTLPTNPKVKKFIKLVPKLSSLEQTKLWEIFVNEIYDPNFFTQAKRCLEKESEAINELFLFLIDFKRNWDFKIYPKYKFILTAYGSEGNYNPSDGSIKLVIGSGGKIKDPHPINTIVHEIVHLGIEESIVELFNLKFWEKERLVDLICLRLLNKIVVDYSLQEAGDRRIDTYIDEDALSNLPVAISQYIEDTRVKLST